MQVQANGGANKVMTPEQIGGMVGVGLASGAAVFAAVRKWFNPSEKKIDAMAGELGVCEGGTPSGSPTLASLVMSTATSVQRLEGHAEKNADGIQRLLDVQEIHGNKLNLHERRLETIETKATAFAIQAEAMEANTGAVRANAEAVRANAEAVRANAEAVSDRKNLADQLAMANISLSKLLGRDRAKSKLKQGKR